MHRFHINWRPLPARGQATPLFALIVALMATAFLAVPEVVPPWRQELPPRERPITVTIGGTTVLAELSDEPEERSIGLGYRDGLAPGTGMLFVFPEPEPLTFWMYGMRFCLDIIWINDGVVTGAAESACPSPIGTDIEDLPRSPSPGPAQYVLEVPAGFMETHGIEPGAEVSFDPEPALPAR
ncbi:MAG: DUF192 domain-containing protein [Thermomicrobiales bacterium]